MAVISTFQLPTEACTYNQEDGSDLTCRVELFETVLHSVVELGIVGNASYVCHGKAV